MRCCKSTLVNTIFLLLPIAGTAYGQSGAFDCAKYYDSIDSLSKDKIIDWTESPIEIVGGIDRLTELIRYPKSGLENRIQGRVFVRFVIDENSQLRCLQIVSGIREDFDNEALRVIKLLQFQPATSNGKPVTSSMFLPVIFKLRE